MGRSCIGVIPLLLDDAHHLALAVACVVSLVLAVDESHVRLVAGMLGDVAIPDGDAVLVDPTGCGLAEAFASGTHACGVNVTLGIFPTALEQNEDLGIVLLSCECFLLAETAGVDGCFAGSYQAVVKLQEFGSVREGNSHVHLAIRTLGALDGFEHLAQEDGS